MTRPKYLLISDNEPTGVYIQTLVETNPNLDFLGIETFNNGSAPLLNSITQHSPDILLVNLALEKEKKDELIKYAKDKELTVQLSFFNHDIEIVPPLLNNLPPKLIKPAMNLSGDQNSLRKFLDEYYDEESGKSSDFIFIKSEKKMVKIRLNEIAYIQAMADYVKIYLDNDMKYVTQKTMSKIMEYLPHAKFIRINRSYIINGTKIDSFSSTHVYIDDKEIPIGQGFKETFKKLIKTL